MNLHFLIKETEGGIMTFKKIIIMLAAAVPAAYGIPIQVMNTWEIDWATDVQDISLSENEGQLLIRSNTDGKIYLANISDCSYQGEIDLPEGIDGFGLAFDEDRYFVSSSQGIIHHSDGSDT